MTPRIESVVAAIAGFGLLVCTSVVAEVKAGESGFLQDYSLLSDADPKGFLQRVYVRGGVDWTVYDKILLHDVSFFFAEDAEYKGFEANELAELSKAFQQAIVMNLSGPYEFTDTPGPGVLRMRVAVTNLVPSNSVSGTVTTIIPIGLGVSAVSKAVTGSHIGMGSATFEGEMLDAQTGEVVMAGMDEKTGRKWNLEDSATKWGHIRDVFNTWSQNLRIRLDELSGRE